MVSCGEKWVKNCERVQWTMKRAIFGAAVKIFKAKAAEYFGHRKNGILRREVGKELRARFINRIEFESLNHCYATVLLPLKRKAFDVPRGTSKMEIFNKI